MNSELITILKSIKEDLSKEFDESVTKALNTIMLMQLVDEEIGRLEKFEDKKSDKDFEKLFQELMERLMK